MTADARRPARAADRRDSAGPVCALGLDLGTSSAKAVVVDTGGQVLSQASAGYTVTSAMAGYAESEPAHWWSAVTACAREAVRAAGARPSAIGLSGQMHGLVLASRDGGALRPALLWADSRATESLRAYQVLGARALARLANPLAPGMTGPLLKWVADHEPRTYSEARWALQPKDWIRARLTGEFHAEPSDACDPALRGSWTALSLAGDRASLLRSALEGTAFAIRDALDALLGEQRPAHLRLAGGGTLAAGWRQMLADVLEFPLYAVDVPAASGRGAALLGANAAGLVSLGDIQGPLAPSARLVAEPDPAAAAFHRERHARFRLIVSALKITGATAGRLAGPSAGAEGAA